MLPSELPCASLRHMTLIQLFIPLATGPGQPGAGQIELAALERDLADAFGGVTAFVHNPAVGLWHEGEDHPVEDRVVLFEIMTEHLDREWWATYKEGLRTRLRQEEILIRTLTTEKL